MKKLVFGAVATSLLLAGCAGKEHRARSDFEYIESKTNPEYKVPEGLDTPEKQADFRIPEVVRTQETAIGEDLDISAPIQVLTLVDGSLHPQGEERRASIEFDIARQKGKNSIDGIWAALKNLLKKNGVEAQHFDKDKGVLVTEWLVAKHEKEKTYLFGLEDYLFGLEDYLWYKDGDLEVRARYSFDLETSRSGRTAKLSAVMVDFERYQDGQLVRTIPTQVERDSFTVDALNQVVKQYQDDMIMTEEEKVLAQQRAMALSLQVDQHGLSTIVAGIPFNQAWDSAGSLFKSAGFIVEDKDRIQATYFVKVPNDWSIMDLFGDSGRSLDIAPGAYKLFFGDRGDTTTISVYDDDNKPLDEEDTAKVYNALQEVLLSLRAD